MLMLSKIYGGIAFICIFFIIPGAVESEMYITAVVLIAISGLLVYLALKEDGQIRKKKNPRYRGRE